MHAEDNFEENKKLQKNNSENLEKNSDNLKEIKRDDKILEENFKTSMRDYDKEKVSVKVFNLISGKEVNSVELSGLFNYDFRIDILQEILHWQMDKARTATASTKNVSEVSGSGKKRRQQKKSGRARMGHSRPPHFIHGAVAHGPNGRIYAYSMPKKKIKIALLIALSQKIRENSLIVVENLNLPEINTKNFNQNLNNFSNIDNFLIVNKTEDKNIALSARNLIRCNVLNENGINPLSIVKHRKILIGLDTLKSLEEKLKSHLIKENHG